MNALKLNIHKNTLRTAFANEKKNKQKLQKVDGILYGINLNYNGTVCMHDLRAFDQLHDSRSTKK